MPTDPDRNKRNAMAFYDLMFNECRPREAMEEYVGDRYIQHNPHVGNGKEANTGEFVQGRKGARLLVSKGILERNLPVTFTYIDGTGRQGDIQMRFYDVRGNLENRVDFEKVNNTFRVSWLPSDSQGNPLEVGRYPYRLYAGEKVMEQGAL